MKKVRLNSFKARAALKSCAKTYEIFRLESLSRHPIQQLPFSLRIFLENLLRNEDGHLITSKMVETVAGWAQLKNAPEAPFLPARVLMQDFTGVPAVVDLAAMRDAMKQLGQDPKRINPLVPVDLVVDHSVQVDHYGHASAFALNAATEFERNKERYLFLKWGQNAFENFSVVPPETGIVHQVNLEYIARVVCTRQEGDSMLAYPDTLVGTDSHTTMINGLGVLGWGVGGIEAEAVMLGQPLAMLVPDVVGFKLIGALKEGATATDAVLTVTEMLRKKGVVEKFVEFYGPGIATLPLPDRATIANMCPEYGATVGFFPVDSKTLDYLSMTGRSEELIRLIEDYCKAQGLYRTNSTPDPTFSDSLELDLSTVEPSLAGPRRPQDRVRLSDSRSAWKKALPSLLEKNSSSDSKAEIPVTLDRSNFQLDHGSVVICAITSCTNTSNPSVMVGAGILAKKAVEKGLKSQPWVKTSLAPGSKVVLSYLRHAELLPYLEKLGFYLVGFGCTTCIGNSGPLAEPIANAVVENNLAVVAVLSGNRNFEGRIHPQVKASYLASPPLVVAYALAGRMDIDLLSDPLGIGSDGKAVYLRDIWPSNEEISRTIGSSLQKGMFQEQYSSVYEGDESWKSLAVAGSELYPWDAHSTYVCNPPYFQGFNAQPHTFSDLHQARVLALLGDSVTTDHISPAGNIAKDSPAGIYLQKRGVAPKDFNSYGARRGNHEVMVRGTFANPRIRNCMLQGVTGGRTLHLPDGAPMTIFEAAMRYKEEGVPLIVISGKEYGSGSSRDWAAKGPALLGVRAVLAVSFERIHRANLVGMGILPLQFKNGENAQSLGLTGQEIYDVSGIARELSPKQELTVTAHRPGAGSINFKTVARIDTPVEMEYYRYGGILPYVLSQLLRS